MGVSFKSVEEILKHDTILIVSAITFLLKRTLMKTKVVNILSSFLILSLTLSFTYVQAQEMPAVPDLATTEPFGLRVPSFLERGTKPEAPNLGVPEILSEVVHIDEEYSEREYIPPSPEILAETARMVESFSCSTVTDVPLAECEALVALYNSTNGAGWYNDQNWLITNSVSSWYGIVTVDGHVSKIELWYNILNGTIPSALSNLTYLQELILSGNQLTGIIPPNLGLLSNLLVLMLDWNQLSGSIPAELGNLSNLLGLWLYSNNLSGNIPPELGYLSNLTRFYLQMTDLSGSIPLSFINLQNLANFNFTDTFVCEPDTPEYLTWKANVPDFQGTGINCGDIIGINFRPDIEGYNFENWGSIDLNDYIISDLIRMFGVDAVCWRYNNSFCIVKPIAAEFKAVFHLAMIKGLCAGMSVTSLRFMNEIDTYPGYIKTYDLNKSSPVSVNWIYQSFITSARRNISYFHILQITNPVKRERESAFMLEPSQIFNHILSTFTSSDPDYVTLGVCKPGKEKCHALTPYAILDMGNNKFMVKVYDSNYPGDNNRFVLFDNPNESWSYDAGKFGIYSGDSQSNTMSMTSLSNYALQPECPWCTSAINTVPEAQIWFDGDGDVLIMDSQSRRLGHQNGFYYEEIPGAFGNPIEGGLGFDQEPIYSLPLADDYVITLTGPETKLAEDSSLKLFGPNYAVLVEDLWLDSTSSDVITFSNDGSSISYQPNQAQQATLGLLLDTADASWQLEARQLNIAAGETKLISADVNQKLFEITNNHNLSGDYNLALKRVGDNGIDYFYNNDITLPALATHYLHFDGWQTTSTLQLDVDFDGDEIPDETTFLENQVEMIYLPLITK